MRHLHDTHSKLRRRIKFYGLEGSIYPIIIATVVSIMAVSVAVQRASIPLAIFGASPFFLTVGYFLFFVTGRRPHFTRDLVGLAIHGKSVTPAPRKEQPRHPGFEEETDAHRPRPRLPRAVHTYERTR